MNFIDNIPYDKHILYDDSFFYQGTRQSIYFQKTMPSFTSKDHFFLKSFIRLGTGVICQGYIYFYLNEAKRSSDFIGVFVKPEYRNKRIASLLVANWIDFCINNGYNFLGTNERQRKPFLLYLLKTYGFEILDLESYMTNKNVIHICRKDNDPTKYLLFKNKKQEATFMNGKIAKADNYQVISQLGHNITYLDSVILSRLYMMQDGFKAKEKSKLVIKRSK